MNNKNDMSINSNKKDMTWTRLRSAGKCNCCVMRYEGDYSELGGNVEYICRWRYFLKWACGIGTIVFILGIIIVFTAYLPNVAQSSMDDSQLIQLYLSMIEPTNNSITLNSTMQIVNAGVYDATLEQTTATLMYKNKRIGTFTQPTIVIAGGTGAIFNLEAKIAITTSSGLSNFRDMSTEILKGNDVTVTIKAKPKLKPKVMGISLPQVQVNMNKDLIIPGAFMQNAYIKNITNMTGNDAGTEVVCDTEIEFSIDSPFHLFGGKIEVDIYDVYNNQLGYAIIHALEIIPGYNKLTPIRSHFVYCKHCSNTTGNNNKSVDAFVSNYGGGVNQILNMRGPKGDLVISHTINSNAIVYAYCYPSEMGYDNLY